MNHRILLVSITLFIAVNSNAQLTDLQTRKIDSLFLNWNVPNHPGGVVGIAKNDQILFLKAYGLASLEYLVPNATSTRFNIASVSKQFTAMGIVLLDIEGRLSVDDDIRKYIPELPDFGEKITIRHMLHHTSGLRSLHALLGMAGWRSDDRRSNEDLYRLMENQQALNFKPGDEYLYCNTGYMYMAKIIESVTGEDFAPWMKKSIFEPLGMTATYVEDQYNRVVTENATSYSGSRRNGFDRSVEYWDYVGSGNMHSTATDLLTWASNFIKPEPGWESHFEMMQTLDKFNNGDHNDYAFGVRIADFNGFKSVGHGGSIGGFRSGIVTYPEKELSIVIITNFSSSSLGPKLNSISEMLLGIETPETKTYTSTDIKTIKVSKKELIKYEGSYWNDRDMFARKIYLKDDTLRYFRSENSESPIVPVGQNEFQMLDISEKLIIRFEIKEDHKSMITVANDGPPVTYQEFEPVDFDESGLSLYTGEYYSPELETTYRIYLKEDTLYQHHSRHGDAPMKIIKEDMLEGEWPLNIARVKLNQKGEITGLFVTNGRVRNMWFAKQE